MSDDPPPNRRGALIAMLAVVAVIAIGWWLSGRLHGTSRLQDCVMAGRNNCAPIDAATGAQAPPR